MSNQPPPESTTRTQVRNLAILLGLVVLIPGVIVGMIFLGRTLEFSLAKKKERVITSPAPIDPGLMDHSGRVNQASKRAVTSFATAVRIGKLDDAYAFTSTAFRGRIGRPMFEQFLRDQHMLAAAAATSPVEFEAVWVRSEVKAPAVRHRYQLSGGGISTTIHVETVKEGEEWKVDYLGE